MKQFISNWLIILFLGLGSWIWAYPAEALTITDSELEAAVLQVIQQHPDAILNSLIEYQSQSANPHRIDLPFKQVQRWVGTDPVQGDLSLAKAVLIEFSDFQCPYCTAAAPQLHTFIDQHPDIAFVYKHLPLDDLHSQATEAAKAAWAAGRQGKFWEYHDALFTQLHLTQDTYPQIARQLELNLEQFERDRQSDQAAQLIRWNISQAQAFNISATPTFVVVTHELSALVSGADLDQISSLLLARSRPTSGDRDRSSKDLS